MGKTAKRMALGTLFAAAAGYLAGLLTAPKSGRETRAGIKQKTNAQISETEKQLKKIHTQLNDLTAQAKERATQLEGRARKELDEVVAKTSDVREKVREVLSNVHEGKLSEDKDLQTVLASANKTIENLKKYVSKDAEKLSEDKSKK